MTKILIEKDFDEPEETVILGLRPGSSGEIELVSLFPDKGIDLFIATISRDGLCIHSAGAPTGIAEDTYGGIKVTRNYALPLTEDF